MIFWLWNVVYEEKIFQGKEAQGLKEFDMLKPWLKSFKNIFKNNGTDKFLKKPQNRRTALELLSLEERLNLSTVSFGLIYKF